MRTWLLLLASIGYCSVAMACKPFTHTRIEFPVGLHSVNEIGVERLSKALAPYQPLEKSTVLVILIVGNASKDESPNEKEREALSIKRASAVRDWLVSQGIPYSKIYVEGKGSINVYENSPNAGRFVEVELGIVPDPDPCGNQPPRISPKPIQ